MLSTRSQTRARSAQARPASTTELPGRGQGLSAYNLGEELLQPAVMARREVQSTGPTTIAQTCLILNARTPAGRKQALSIPTGHGPAASSPVDRRTAGRRPDAGQTAADSSSDVGASAVTRLADSPRAGSAGSPVAQAMTVDPGQLRELVKELVQEALSTTTTTSVVLDAASPEEASQYTSSSPVVPEVSAQQSPGTVICINLKVTSNPVPYRVGCVK